MHRGGGLFLWHSCGCIFEVMEDVIALQERAGRDALDGAIDDPKLKADYTKEIREAVAALSDTLQRLGTSN